MFSTHFYHGITRKTVAVFGSIFNNIFVIRKNADGSIIDTQRVPIAYGPKQKFLTRLDEQPDIEQNPIAIKLPRMSYEIVGLTPDPARNLGRLTEIRTVLTDGSVAGLAQITPYKLTFALTAYVKNQDDGFQIVEQILPYFKPEYIVAVKYFGSDTPPIDVPFTLTGTNLTDLYEGTATDRRSIQFGMSFDASIWFYGPIVDRSQIKTVVVDFADSIDPGTAGDQETWAVTPPTASETDDHTITVTLNSGVSLA